MDRMACVNLPAFPLQLLIQRHPDWKTQPVVVVDKDKPRGIILWVNKRASRSSIMSGMCYAKALSLTPDLRAGEVSGSEIQKHIEGLTERLRFFTPDVEPSEHEPGVFWLNASGLSLLYPSIKKWAGLIVSESDYAHRTIAEVLPLREVFAVVFFVSIGMLVDPGSLVDNPEIVLGIAAVAVLGKIVTVSAASALLGFPPRAIVAASLALANMGEFSFVLLTEAVREDVIGPKGLNEALLTSVLISIAVSPLLFAAQDPIFRAMQRLPVLGRITTTRMEVHVPEDVRLANHAVIVGYKEAGQEVARMLRARDFRYIVIDEDPGALRELAAQDVPYIVGNAALPFVLEQAALERARVLVVTTGDPGMVEGIVITSRDLNPRIDIVAHGAFEEGRRRLRELGVSQIVHAEFELGIQFVRHTLHRFGVSNAEIQAIVSRRRRDVLR